MEPDPRELPGFSQPLYGICGETQEPCIKQTRGNMSIRRKLGRSKATGEGAPGGVSICSQLTRVSHPNSLLGAVTRLALCYIQTSSPLTMLIWEHHPAGAPPAWGPSACPPSFTSPTKAVDTPTLHDHHKPLVKGEKGASLLPVEVRASFSI